ncbi:concanavalin A-like lectin/glucanase [Thozetella sp. PMI_491]|nr:concanavalin A-like lectin/glucanase [Thozetella sp. PMI_491]
MRLSSSTKLLIASLAHAHGQYLANELSFGYGHRISPEGSTSIPNFAIQGNPNLPEVLSNKLILTPPAPGNQRGAVWSDRSLQKSDWIIDVEFRTNGPERAGGNFNIWVARDGAHEIGSASVFTAGKFEGLVLVVDQYGGSSGTIRGFLNDGTTDYKSQHNIDGLAFGHCYFAYRNLGRPSQIKLRHSNNGLKVEVDGNSCIETSKVRIPSGYRIGITAASAENPDSFEVFKLVTLTEEAHNTGSEQDYESNYARDPPTKGQDQQQVRFGRSGQVVEGQAGQQDYDDDLPDASADTITSSKAQFADLHNRIQSSNHHLSTIFRKMGQNDVVGEKRHEELSVMLGEIKGLLTKLDSINALDSRIKDLEKETRQLRNELTSQVRTSENSIKYHLNDKHEQMSDHVFKHRTGHTRLIVVIIAGQLVLLGGYVYYKRRKATPKKYL